MARGRQAAVFAIVPTFIVVMAWTRRWMADDGFIYLRVVQNVLAGNGPVYNAGERMETATDPVWVGVVSAVKLILSPMSLEHIVVILGIVFMAGALVIAQLTGLVIWERSDNAVLVPFGLLVVAGMSAYWDFATGGLDTALVLLWLSASFGLLAVMGVRGLTGWRLWLAALVVGIGLILRPDLAPYALAFLAVGVWNQIELGWRHCFGWLTAAVAVPVGYMIFRMGYFGAVVPAPAITKGASRSDWAAGALFVLNTVETYFLVIPLAAILVACYLLVTRAQGWIATRPLRVLVIGMYGAVAVQLAFIVRLGGGFMHARLLLPALFALLLPIAVLPFRRAVTLVPWVIVVSWAIISAVGLRPLNMIGYIVDERAFYVMYSEVDHPVRLGDEPIQFWAVAGIQHGLLLGTPEAPLLVLPATSDHWNFLDGPVFEATPVIAGARVYSPQSGIGMYAFAAPLDLHVVDRFGLADPIASRQSQEQPGRPGHAKVLPLEWVVARFAAEPIDLAYLDPEKVRAATHALTCEPIAELIAAATDPLTPARFWANLIGAPSRTLLRISPNPVDAVAQHCTGDEIGVPLGSSSTNVNRDRVEE